MLPEIVLIIMSVSIGNRYSKAKASGAGKYIRGIWITWLVTFIVAIGTAIIGTRGLGIVVGIIGYGICFLVAAIGMSSGKEQLELYDARVRDLEYTMRERQFEQQTKEMEQQVQKRVDAAVTAALAQHGIVSHVEPESQPEVEPELQPADIPRMEDGEAYLLEGSNDYSWKCSVCGGEQRSNRYMCYRCGVDFEKKKQESNSEKHYE